jgi:hypothetical protein
LAAADNLRRGNNKKEIRRLIEEREYLLAAELLNRQLGSRWPELLREEFAQVGDPSELHRAILLLKQRIVITTNFDKLLETAYSTSGETHHPQLATRSEPKVFKALRDDELHLIKLHGTIDDEESLIFTSSSYKKQAYGNWFYSALLQNLLLTHTFLFIGFSMSDPAVSLAVEVHAQRFPDTRPHYIILPEPVSEQMIEVSKQLRGLYVIPYSPARNHRQLPALIKRLATAADVRRVELRAAGE